MTTQRIRLLVEKTGQVRYLSILFLSEVGHLGEKKTTKCRTLLISKQVSKYFTWHRQLHIRAVCFACADPGGGGGG